MTNLLKRAFDEASKLPEREQDALAKSLLHDLESEKNWTNAFSTSNVDKLASLAQSAVQEHKAGKTEQLDPEAL
jgi:hypothetical protein